MSKPFIIFKATQIGQRIGSDPRTVLARIERMGLAPIAVDVSGTPYFSPDVVDKLSGIEILNTEEVQS